METLKTLTYRVDGRIGRITLNRPDRGNGITLEMPAELAACVERANLDPAVHVIALSGSGAGFCGGYDLVAAAEKMGSEPSAAASPEGSPTDPREAVAWGLATEAPSADRLDERCEILLERIARLPVNQLVMMKLLLNQTVLSQGLASTQILGTVFDGIARHTREGYAFQKRCAEVGFKQAVRERDEPFGDFGRSVFKG